MLPYGCRNGACGTCKGKILEGDVDYGAHQASTLTDDEKRGAGALLLREAAHRSRDRGARGAARRRHPDSQAAVPRSRRSTKPAPDVAIVKLKLPANERLQYLAGQYIDFLLKDGRRRSFSLANAAARRRAARAAHPPHPGRLLHRPAVQRSSRAARSCASKGRSATFFLREESDKPIIFVAGGTGFAPIKAVDRARAPPSASTAPADGAVLGRARAARSLPARPARRSGSASIANFTFIPVLSEPRPDDAGRGAPASSTRRCCDDFPDLSGYQVYACGGPAMIDVARKTSRRRARCRRTSSSPTASRTQYSRVI